MMAIVMADDDLHLRSDAERIAALEVKIDALSSQIADDLAQTRREMILVEEHATKADRFVRRVIYGAASMIAGSIVAAVILIYQACGRAEAAKAEAREQKQEIMNRLDKVEDALTEVRSQAKLLLEAQLRNHRP